MFNLNGFGKLISKTKAASRSMLSIVLALCLVAVMLPTGLGNMSVSADAWDGTTVATGFAGGSGTEGDPYLIATPEQLAYLKQTTSLYSAGKYFKLTADIDLSNKEWTKPSTASFKAVLDGDGHTVSGLNSDHGLFYDLNGTIKNLTVIGNVTGSYAGGISGRIGSGAVLENCGFNGNITATGNNVGGLTGHSANSSNTVTIKNCWTAGTITNGVGGTGGLIGNIPSSSKTVTISNCYTTMTITGTGASSQVAGLVGNSSSSAPNFVINNSFFAGSVNTSYPVSRYAASSTTGVYYLAGSYSGTATNHDQATEKATAADAVALLNTAALANGWTPWTTDTQSGYPAFAVAPELTGLTLSTGVLTFDPSVLSYAVAIASETFTVTPTAATGTTVTVDGTFVDSGNASAPITVADGQSKVIEVVVSRDGISYTYTLTVTRNDAAWDGTAIEPFGHYGESGYGTEDKPYEIANGAQLYFLSKTVQETVTLGETEYAKSVYKGKYFKLTADINLSNVNWTPIGDDLGTNGANRFAAAGFDGDGHTISNLLVDRDTDAGLFGYVNGTTVKNLTVEGEINGHMNVGGIAAHAQGATFDNCAFNGTVLAPANASGGGGYVGGLVGRLRSSAVTIRNSWTAGTLKSEKNNVGGIVGAAGTVPLTLTNSYSVMTVKRVSDLGTTSESDNKTNTNGPGGLVGSGSAVTLSNCHFAGYVNNGCPITISAPLSADNVFYKADSYNVEFGLSDTTAGASRSADEFNDGAVTEALNGLVTASNGFNPWMTGANGYPVFKPVSKLADLSISQGTIFFDPSVYEYQVTVRDTVSSVTVTPFAAEGYVIQVNGTAVNSGDASAATALTIGQTTDIVIGVAPADEPTAFTEYTVRVKRATVPPAGTWDGTYEKFADGSGTVDSPYQIANARQLAFLAAMVNGQTVVIDGETITPPEAQYGLVYNADYFVLTADIVLNDVSDIAGWGTAAPVNIWTPIGGKFGESSRHFGGTFDGAGYTVSGLYCKDTTDGRGVGLFGTSSTATIKDLTVKDAYVEGVNYVGGITGKLGDSSKLVNCSFTGTVVSAGSYVGGLVGQILGSNITVTGCWTEGDLFGARSIGGLAGRAAAGAQNATVAIEFSYSAMNITSSATAAVGGLVGTIGGAANSTVSITGCHFAGTSNLNFPVVGTMETGTYTAVTRNVYYRADCCATPTAVLTEEAKSVDEFKDGIVADLLNQSVLGTTNWSTDAVKGYPIIKTVTGDVALNDLVLSAGVITFDSETYLYTVSVPYKADKVTIVPFADNGVVIKVNGQVVESEAASQAIELQVGVAERFTVQVSRDGASITYGVDVVRREQAPDGVWDGSYEAFDTSNDAGTTLENPILIKNEAQFAFFAAMVSGQKVMVDGKIYSAAKSNSSGQVYEDTYFQLKADLTLNSVDDYADWDTVAPANVWTPIGYCQELARDARMFGGIFDGDHHTITGVYVDEPERGVEGTGLFGATSGAIIRNLHVRNGYIKGSQRIGGIVGRCRNSITIQNCSFVGTIKSSVTSTAHHSYAAGIIGDANGKTYVKSCWSEGTVIGSMGTAGLVGGMYLSGTYEVSNSYSSMDIQTADGCTKTGGLVGALSRGGTVLIRRCHFAGTVNANTPIIGGTDGTGAQTITTTDVYYRAGSYVGTAVDASLSDTAEEMSAEEFADGTVTALLNDAATYGDFWNWKDGENGYPVSDGVILVTDYKDYTDDSVYDDGNWADGFVNMDDDAVSGSSNGSGNGSGNSPITGEKSIYIAVIVLLLISAVSVFLLARRKRSAN